MKHHPEETLKEALAVRDEGQEPQQEPEVYEQALLYIAHREQKLTEDFPTALARVVRTSDDANALVFAADRRRDADLAGGKVPGSDTQPALVERKSKSVAEAEMLAIAKREARPGESVALAYARLCETDDRMAKLYDSAETATPTDERFDRLLLGMAAAEKRQGETLEKAVARLLESDPIVRDASAAAQGL